MAKPTPKSLRKLIGKALPTELIETKAGWIWKCGSNYGVIDLQLDKYSTSDTISVTVNIGVYSSLLASFFDGVDFQVKGMPPSDTSNCAFRDRLGFVTPSKQDLWWEVSLSNAEQIAFEIAGLITQYGIPFITSKLDDRSLVEGWSSLLSELGYKELRFLAALACSLNAKDLMNEALDALEERFGREELVLNLNAFIKNMKEHGLGTRPVLSDSALELRRQIDEIAAKKARKSKRLSPG